MLSELKLMLVGILPFTEQVKETNKQTKHQTKLNIPSHWHEPSSDVIPHSVLLTG